MTFLSSDEPEDIISVMEYSPEFREMYEDIYDVCRNMEGVMDMFSKELAILDRNTVQLMIDEMKEDMERQAKVLEEQAKVLEEQAKAIEEQEKVLEEKDKVLEEKDKLLTVENAERNLLRLASSVIKVRNEHPKWGYDQIAETCNCNATTVESILAILD